MFMFNSNYLKSITNFALSTLPIWRIVCLGFSCLNKHGMFRVLEIVCVWWLKIRRVVEMLPWVWAESSSQSFVFLDLFFLCLWSPTHAAWWSIEKQKKKTESIQSFRRYTNESSPWDLLCCNVVSLSIASELDPYSQANLAVVY